MNPVIRIHPSDNVVVAFASLPQGTCLGDGFGGVVLRQDIPAAHKIALEPIPSGMPVKKYGQPIGLATRDIQPGEWVHCHNLRTGLSGIQQYIYEPAPQPEVAVGPDELFDGYLRCSGEVGIRNEIWVIPTVGCVNDIARRIVQTVQMDPLPANVDGNHLFSHPYGCSQLGEDHQHTQTILARLAQHPNAGGVLVVGLGCENNTMKSFQEALGKFDAARFRFMVTQECQDEVADGVRLLQELVEHADAFRRTPQPVSRLCVGLKCGGSDAFSGITANPLVGRFSDEWVRCGGATLLTEVPEMFGAESVFMNRCESRPVFDACAAMVNGFKEYFLRHSQPVYENPSPGNKDGGITTLEEKSLGCLQKGGTSPVREVIPYGGKASRSGLVFMNGPGNDIVSVTALSDAGSQLVLFTTGRGTPLGAPVPTIKISSNSDLARRKPHWIDFDAGRLLQGEAMDALVEELKKRVIEIASGRGRTRNETNNCRDIAIFKDGVTL